MQRRPVSGAMHCRCVTQRRCVTSSSETSRVPLATWRMWLSAEQLLRIDRLTYQLGRYPQQTAAADAEVSKAAQRAKPAASRRRRRLDKLTTAHATRPTGADTSMMIESAAQPYTPLRVWRNATTAAVTASSSSIASSDTVLPDEAVLTHPGTLFDDEAAVLWRFGMGGVASPHVSGFDGHFRQHWQDFWVTEMVTDVTTPSGGRPVSRDLSFDVPPLPAGLREPQSPATRDDDASATSDAPDESFFRVNVKERLAELMHEESVTHPPADADARQATDDLQARQRSLDALEAREEALMQDTLRPARPGTYYLQCTLHKQHVAHGTAMSGIAQVLRIHPRAISVSGIKDYVGDTVQRVRLENVAPHAALAANAIFRRKNWHMTLSDFSYESVPLVPGDHFGNHFRIVLRGVTAGSGVLQDALDAFQRNGFPNYYGCQRFSWFGGRDDAAFALLRHDWLGFAFRFLNYTDKALTLRELLQRPSKYPHPLQDQYRRNIVRRLRQAGIAPHDLDTPPFLCCPGTGAMTPDGAREATKLELVVWQLQAAYMDLDLTSRRLTAQRAVSYLWNQVLTLRLHHFGAQEVLCGDFVAPASLRQMARSRWDRSAWHALHRDVVTPENRHRYTIRDVLHPGFSFDAIMLPENAVGSYYLQICDKYHLDWFAQHSRSGLRDFQEPPRPIVRHPIDLRYTHDVAAATLTVSFALERGCYANVAITELMKATRCVGAETTVTLPAPGALWEGLGSPDHGYVTSVQDIYQGYEDGVGFVGDSHDLPRVAEEKVWDHDGPLFLPDHADPYRRAFRWGRRNLLRNSQRREQDAEALKRSLFERPLAQRLTPDELARYAGHTVPLPPNGRGKKVFFKVLKRKRRYVGAPRMLPRLRRGAAPAHRKAPAFRTLSKEDWNVMW